MKRLSKEVRDVIKILEERNLIDVLRMCHDIGDRYEKLTQVLPETNHWGSMLKNQLVVYLERKHKLEFGVCPYYQIEGDKQYCIHGGTKLECLCLVPQPQCVFRDIDLLKSFLPPDLLPSKGAAS